MFTKLFASMVLKVKNKYSFGLLQTLILKVWLFQTQCHLEKKENRGKQKSWSPVKKTEDISINKIWQA